MTIIITAIHLSELDCPKTREFPLSKAILGTAISLPSKIAAWGDSVNSSVKLLVPQELLPKMFFREVPKRIRSKTAPETIKILKTPFLVILVTFYGSIYLWRQTVPS